MTASTKPVAAVLANGISRHAFAAEQRPAPQRFVSEPLPHTQLQHIPTVTADEAGDASMLRVRLAVYEAALKRIVEGCPVQGCQADTVEAYLVNIARAALEVG